jgi:hypothetical protein
MPLLTWRTSCPSSWSSPRRRRYPYPSLQAGSDAQRCVSVNCIGGLGFARSVARVCKGASREVGLSTGRPAPGDVFHKVVLTSTGSTRPQIKGIKACLIPERQRLTIPGAAGAKPTVLVRGKTLAELGVKVRIRLSRKPPPARALESAMGFRTARVFRTRLCMVWWVGTR